MTDTSKILNGLQPGGTYSVQVRSKNGAGETSDWSTAYTFQTPGNLLTTVNSTVAEYLAGGVAGLYSSSNLYMTSTGIYGWSGPGVRTFFIDSVTGNAFFSGSVVAGAGSIGGWNIIPNELYSGSVHINSQTPAIYIGRGVHADVQTPFYVDGASRFSIGNNFVYYPAYGNAITIQTTGNTASVSSNGASVAVYDPIAASIQSTMLVTGSAFAVGTSASAVTYVSPSVAVVLLSTPAVVTGSVNATFQMDSYSELIVRGKISGIVETTTALSSAVLSNFVTSASVGPTPDKIYFTTASGHAWTVGTTLIFQGLSSGTPLFSNMEYTLTHNSFQIVAVPNSSVFVVSVGAASTAFTANTNYVFGTGGSSGADVYLDTYTDLYGGNTGNAAIASMQELTLGSYPVEVGNASPRQAGAGLRLDPYNYWLVNNQFRVGSDQTSMTWDGSKFQLNNNAVNANLALNVGGTKSYISMFSTGSPNWTGANTSFYVDSFGYLSVGGSAMIFDPTAGLTVNGTINAGQGLIGGFAITASSLIGNSAASVAAGGQLQLNPYKNQLKFINPTATQAPFGSIRLNSINDQYQTHAEFKDDLLSNVSSANGNNGGATIYRYFDEIGWSRFHIENWFSDGSNGSGGGPGPNAAPPARIFMESRVGSQDIFGNIIPPSGSIAMYVGSTDDTTILSQLALDINGATLAGNGVIVTGLGVQVGAVGPLALSAGTGLTENITGNSLEYISGNKVIQPANIALQASNQVTVGRGGTIGTPGTAGSFAVTNVPTTNNTYPAYFYYTSAGIDGRYYFFMSRSTSSSATKNFIDNYAVSISDFMQLRPVLFSMKEDESNTPKPGFYAEEVNEIDSLKHYVTYNPEDKNQPEGLDYAPMVTMLTSVVQQQQRMIEELSASVSALQTAIIGLGEK